jgi:drug/metabolite transporter (DMT)-like permease
MALTPRTALLLTLPPLMWAGNAVVGRLMVGHVSPLTLNFLRWALVALLLLPFAGRALRPWSQLWRPAGRAPYLAAIGLLGVGVYNALQYAALVTSTPLNVTLVASSMPVWMLAVGRLAFGVHASRRQWLGAVLGLAGVALVLGRGSWQTLAGVRFVPGDLFVLVAAIGWAFYSWLLARRPAHMQGEQQPPWDWSAMLLVQVLFGLVPAGLLAAGEQLAGAPPLRWDGALLAALAYVSVGASIVAYRGWGLGVALGGPTLAAFFGNLTPLFAALLSALVLDEAPRWYHAAAFALIVAGIAVSTPRAAAQKLPG